VEFAANCDDLPERKALSELAHHHPSKAGFLAMLPVNCPAFRDIPHSPFHQFLLARKIVLNSRTKMADV
jgi:hypothetical protein